MPSHSLPVVGLLQTRRHADHGQRQERAEHEHVAVGEVDQLDDPIDHRVAEGDQREQRAVGQPDQGVLQERLPGTRESAAANEARRSSAGCHPVAGDECVGRGGE